MRECRGWRAEIGHRPFNFGPPNEAQRPLRTRQASVANQLHQHASRFQNGHASAAVVICSRPRVVEMAAVNNFAAGRISAGDDSAYYRPVPGPNLGLYFRVQKRSRFSCPQSAAQRFRRVACETHEGETLRAGAHPVWPHGAQSVRSSPDHAVIWFGISLTMPTAPYLTTASQGLHPCQDAIRQNDLPPHIVAAVVSLMAAVADIDERRLHIRRMTVVSQPNRDRWPSRH